MLIFKPHLQAIRDGVIDATIDHENGYMKSKVSETGVFSIKKAQRLTKPMVKMPTPVQFQENVDIYSTNEPQVAFHQRISFCLNLHNESVKVS